MKYIGLDVHSTHINYAVINDAGILIKENSFKTSLENLISLSELFKPPIKIVFEEGELANWIYQGIDYYFQEVIICDPMENKQIYQSQKKTDKIDALKLAHLLRSKFIKPVYHTKDQNRVNFKQLVYAYHDMTKQVTRTKNKIKAHFRKQGVIIKTTSVYHSTNRNEYLQQCSHPNLIIDYYEQLDFFTTQKENYRKQISKNNKSNPVVQNFMKIPGIGDITASTFFCIMDIPERFHHVQQVWNYAHLGKAIYESANTQRNKKLKKGNRLLKGVLLQSVQSALRQHTNYFHQAFVYMTEIEHKEKKLAKRIIARKLIATMWSMWLKNTTYKPKDFFQERIQHGLMN